MPSYYDTLGVSKNANTNEIRQAFRKLARKHHPDLNPGDESASEKFKQINEAYEILSDTDKRKKYDRYGEKWRHADQFDSQFSASSPFTWTHRSKQPTDFFGGFTDLFGGSGQPTTTTRAEVSVDISLEEAFSGSQRKVTISSPTGKQRRIEVKIPKGVDTGSVVRITPSNAQELLLKITVSEHSRFVRKGSDLNTDIDIPIDDAILGANIEVQTLKGKVKMSVPPETQNGQKIRLGGLGMPKLGTKETGDLYVVVKLKIPKNLTQKERELFQKLRGLRSKGK